MQYYFGNIEEETLNNWYFRKVIFTGDHCQLVLMSLKPGEEIGLETHPHVDQFFRIEKGEGKMIIGGDEKNIKEGGAFIVPAGTEHNIINTGNTELKIYTIYSPANHIDGRVHKTKADALSDAEDDAFGHR